MANTSPFNLPAELGIDEAALLQELAALEVYESKALPDLCSLLEKLHQEVYEAIRFLNDVATKLEGDFREFERFEKTAESAGLDWATESRLPEPTTLKLGSCVRLDKVHEYLDGPGYLAFRFLRRVGDRIIETQETLTKGLANPKDGKGWLLFLLPGLDQALTDEAYALVAKNVIRAAHARQSGQVAKAVRELTTHLRSLEHRIENKIEEAQYLRAGWKSPSDWIKIWKLYGEEISESTFSRRRADGKIRCHPDSTTKSVAIHFNDLPIEYQIFLEAKSR